MFSPQGRSLRELCIQALSSVERGYDLLAPKFDHTPFRTPQSILGATAPPAPSLSHWATRGSALTRRTRIAVRPPPFVMYYRTSPLLTVRDDLTAAGFTVKAVALTALGRHRDGSPLCGLILARKAG